MSTQVFNGEDESSPLLGDAKRCGGNINFSLLSSYHEATVKLVRRTQGASAPVFDLNWAEESVECGDEIHLTPTSSSGQLQSPNYPQNYPVNTECVWTINAPGNEQVQLDFPSAIDMQHASKYAHHVHCLPDGTL